MKPTVAMWIYPPPKAWQERDLLEWRCIGLLAGASQQERQWKLPQLGFSQWEHQVCIYIYAEFKAASWENDQRFERVVNIM
jgi:hypothetical protein